MSSEGTPGDHRHVGSFGLAYITAPEARRRHAEAALRRRNEGLAAGRVWIAPQPAPSAALSAQEERRADPAPGAPGGPRLMRTGPKLLFVTGHRFLIMAGDQDEAPLGRPDTDVRNGLVDVYGPVIQVHTGIASGELFLEAEFRASAPVAVETDDWDEVVEISVELPVAGARLGGAEDECPWDWPDVNQQGPGWYRLRFHCRGRDLGQDGDEPREHHQVVVWPAPQAPSTLFRLTDHTGRVYRQAGEVRG